ncbi:MAG: prenyltransferase [Chitinophagaceae bacterium]|nr:MAG: prenyltransferase [Chitinophagaceae bacterium]
MLRRSTIQLLRFPFSLFLMPVYLFALSQLPAVDGARALWIFVILHFLVYPASNGYNSYMDRDAGPIGGLEHPLLPTRQLYYATVILDAAAIACSLLFVNALFAGGIAAYILASRAYSYRGIRLKRFPVTGFLTVFVFQGAWIYVFTQSGASAHATIDPVPALVASCLIGALYPLTQVYQHAADRADGVTTLSIRLGTRGSFLFSMLLFLGASAGLYYHFNTLGRVNHFLWFLLEGLPVLGFFGYWMLRVWKNEEAADFRHSFLMSAVATLCTTAYFITLILLKP